MRSERGEGGRRDRPRPRITSAVIAGCLEDDSVAIRVVLDVCAWWVVSYASRRGIADVLLQADLTQDVWEDAIGHAKNHPTTMSDALERFIKKTANRYSQRIARRRPRRSSRSKGERSVEKVRWIAGSKEPMSPSELLEAREHREDVLCRLLDLFLVALTKLERSHPRYARFWYQVCLAPDPASLKPWTQKRAIASIRHSLLEACLEGIAELQSDRSEAEFYHALRDLFEVRRRGREAFTNFLRQLIDYVRSDHSRAIPLIAEMESRSQSRDSPSYRPRGQKGCR